MVTTMGERRFTGLILDFAGVLTTNMVEVIERFEAREKLPRGTFLRAWADPRGQELFRQLELGAISQQAWNVGYAALMSEVLGAVVPPDDLMARYLHDLYPAYAVINVAKQARAAGVKTAVLSNSLGRSPYDPYASYDLPGVFDVVVFSEELGLRKPDPAVFRHTCDLLGLSPGQCVFVDDTEVNLEAAGALGMGIVFSLDERVVASRLRVVLGLPDL